MGLSSSKKIVDEINTKHASHIPESSVDKLFNSIVKIQINESIATGFFMKLNINNKQYHFLLTCNHVINEKLISEESIFEIFYGKIDKEAIKKIKLVHSERFIDTFEKPIDITLIEILKNDDIPEDKFLFMDLNYKNGYDFYINKEFYLAGYPASETHKRERCISSGQIIKIDNFEFEHSLDTRSGSSGSPICLIDNKCVIGIHKGGSNEEPINYGTFIGCIIDELEKRLMNYNNIYIKLPENEKSNIKLCDKCGEIYQILNFVCRQGDLKEVPQWSIIGKSNIKEPKEGIETCIFMNNFTFISSIYRPWKWGYEDNDEDDDDDILDDYDYLNGFSIYDDKALEEIDNGNCLMKGCFGKLFYIKFKTQ